MNLRATPPPGTHLLELRIDEQIRVATLQRSLPERLDLLVAQARDPAHFRPADAQPEALDELVDPARGDAPHVRLLHAVIRSGDAQFEIVRSRPRGTDTQAPSIDRAASSGSLAARAAFTSTARLRPRMCRGQAKATSAFRQAWRTRFQNVTAGRFVRLGWILVAAVERQSQRALRWPPPASACGPSPSQGARAPVPWLARFPAHTAIRRNQRVDVR
jgi:hypothetical protein